MQEEIVDDTIDNLLDSTSRIAKVVADEDMAAGRTMEDMIDDSSAPKGIYKLIRFYEEC